MKKRRLTPIPAHALRPLSAQLEAAAKALSARLHYPAPLRCWGCGEVKAPSPQWRVVAYTPRNPLHPAMAYALCPGCCTRDGIERASLAIETEACELHDEKRRRL